jgi:hypothetical protein
MVVQAQEVSLQALIERDDVGFKDCGVRAMVLVSTPEFFDAYDFSLTIRESMMYGALKAGKARTSIKNVIKHKYSSPLTTPPINFWIAQESEGKAIHPIKKLNGETKGYLLELSDFFPTYDGIMSIIRGKRMQFAVRYKDEPLDTVVSFSAEMPDVERVPLEQCMSEVLNRISNSLKAKSGEVAQ